MKKMRNYFTAKKVLIFGGNGFVGQNLTEYLYRSGASITVFDIKNNISKRKDINYLQGDIRKARQVAMAVKNSEVIIDLAALRPIETMDKPVEDLEITCKGALNILESCKTLNPECKIIFFGSSLEYGEVARLPVSEEYKIYNPDSFYGVHKMVLSHYSRIFWKIAGINSTVLRFSNLYGPEKMTSEKMSIVNLFIKLTLRGKPITIYGEGSQKRDYLYIGDAINAVEKACSTKGTEGEVFNIGSGKPVKLLKMAQTVLRVVGKGQINKIPWPENYNIAPRDFYAATFKAKKILSWRSATSLEKGIELTVKRLKESEKKYV